MPRVSPPIDADKLVSMYAGGASLAHCAREFRTRSVTIRTKLEDLGVTVRTRSEQFRMTPSRVVTIENIEEYAARYLAGEGINRLSIDANVATGTMSKRLRQHGVRIRPQSADAAHAAVRGKRQSAEHLRRRAVTNQSRLVHVGPYEVAFVDLLTERGCEFTQQCAIGKYNVDFALEAPGVAVEIVSGSGKGNTHRTRPERLKYILDQGWHVVEVMVIAPFEGGPTGGSADYVIALAELTSGQPSGCGHHWMVWGDGKPYAAQGRQVN